MEPSEYVSTIQKYLDTQANSKPRAYFNLALVGPAMVYVGLSKANPTPFERKLILAAGLWAMWQAMTYLQSASTHPGTSQALNGSARPHLGFGPGRF